MGWGSFTHNVRKIFSPKNITAATIAPATGGLNLLMTKDNAGNTVLDALRGKTDVDKQNEFNAEQAQLNRDWQENMSNTAYQRGYTDLMMAGLNPNLAGGSGGASTPGGAQASSAGLPESPASAISNVANAASGGISNLANAAKTSAEAEFVPKEKKAQIANTTADTIKKTAETNNINAQTALVREQLQTQIATTDLTNQQTLNQKINNIYESQTGTKMPAGAADRIAARLLNAARKADGTIDATAWEDVAKEITAEITKKVKK